MNKTTNIFLHFSEFPATVPVPYGYPVLQYSTTVPTILITVPREL